ncbi:hypothetical protein Tco_0780159 [Tanacetum coccineum]
MDDLNMTIEEYIKLEEEKACRRGRVFNWQTATYGKIRVNDDLHDLSSMEAEFPAIVINDAFAPQDALQCKSQVSTLVNDDIDFRISFDESDDEDYTIFLSEYDEEEQNILYFNDLFHFNIIHPDDLKSENDNDNNEIDITQSSEDMAPLPPREQRHPFVRYQGLEYTNADIANFEDRLERIYSREIHRVQVIDFLGMPELMRDGLFARMVMEHRDDAGVVVFTSRAWGGYLILGGLWRIQETIELEAALGLHTGDEMESPSFARYWSESERMIPRKGDLHDYWRDILTAGDFLGPPPSYTLIRDLVLRLCHQMMAHSIVGRSQALEKVIVTDLFSLRGMDVARSTSLIYWLVITPELPIIDMGELVRLQVCMEVDDTWAWVAMGPERQHDAAAGALRVAQDAPIIDEGGQADPTPV